jgi:hypothetical protein
MVMAGKEWHGPTGPSFPDYFPITFANRCLSPTSLPLTLSDNR